MIRRRFLGLISVAGATGITALAKSNTTTGGESGATDAVTYKVTGFTCITCATGLETLLGRERGVVAVTASYPEGTAVVHYRSHDISEAAIQSMGFQAQALPQTKG